MCCVPRYDIWWKSRTQSHSSPVPTCIDFSDSTFRIRTTELFPYDANIDTAKQTTRCPTGPLWDCQQADDRRKQDAKCFVNGGKRRPSTIVKWFHNSNYCIVKELIFTTNKEFLTKWSWCVEYIMIQIFTILTKIFKKWIASCQAKKVDITVLLLFTSDFLPF